MKKTGLPLLIWLIVGPVMASAIPLQSEGERHWMRAQKAPSPRYEVKSAENPTHFTPSVHLPSPAHPTMAPDFSDKPSPGSWALIGAVLLGLAFLRHWRSP